MADFDYTLPEDRIAQSPARPRDAARLLVSRPGGIEDRIFHHLTGCLQPGDLLVLNDTRVIPARLVGTRDSGGHTELLLLKPIGATGAWEALVGANKRVRPGWRITLEEGTVLQVGERHGAGFRVSLEASGSGDWAELLERQGRMPLPPYIQSGGAAADRRHYQTVFARHPGAVAAPTAGLHFTPGLLDALERRGVGRVAVTLHVGLGTFQPMRCDDPRDHVMHREWFELSPETVERIEATRRTGGRIVAVGTTAVRVLESAVRPDGTLTPTRGETALFIGPGHRFRWVDLMITNFHLPRSTLLLLVAAFVGKARLDRDYRHALEQGYRFYSYGDANLLFPEDPGRP